jgi:hypothetical protein
MLIIGVFCLNNFNFEALTIYRIGAAERLKRNFIFAFIGIYCLLLLFSQGVIEVAVSLFSVFLFSFVLRGKMKKKGSMGFLARLYKSIFYKYSRDILPVNLNFINNQLFIELCSAELYSGEPVNKNYLIIPENIASIIYYKIDNTLSINYEFAEIDLKTANGDNCKHYKETKSSVTLYIPDNCIENILQQLEENNFKVTFADSTENLEKKENQ